MNRKSIGFLVLVFNIIMVNVFGQISFTASTSSSKIGLGQQFEIEYSLTNLEGDLRLPQINGIQFLGNTGSFTQANSINGKTTRKSTLKFAAQATKLGIVVLPPAQIKANGKTYESNALKFEVVKVNQSGTNPSSTSNSTITMQNGQSTPITTGKRNDNIFVKTNVSKVNPYVGEQVLVKHEIYTSVNFRIIQVDFPKNFQNCWVENIEPSKELVVDRMETINGKRYNVCTIKQSIIFPQKVGKIDLEKINLNVLAELPNKPKSNKNTSGFVDEILESMFSSTSETELSLSSSDVNIIAKELPNTNTPNAFQNAIGQYQLSFDHNKKNITTDDIDTIILKIKGIGNLKSLTPPKISSSEIEVYQVSSVDNISIENGKMIGEKTFIYSIAPKKLGEILLEPIQFSYFDISTETYKTLATDSFRWHVSPGKNDDKLSKIQNQMPVPYISNHSTQKINYWIGNSLFLGLALSPLLGVIGLFGFKNRDKLFKINKRKLAYIFDKNEAIERLQVAKSFMHQNKPTEFYSEVIQVLWKYISQKSNLPYSKMSKEVIQNYLISKNLEPIWVNHFGEIVDVCQMGIYASQNMKEKQNQVFNNTLELINHLEKSW